MKFMAITKRFGFVMVTVLVGFQLIFLCADTALGLSIEPSIGKWKGITDQDKEVLFTVSDDGQFILNFTVTVRLYRDIIDTVGKTINMTIDRMHISNSSFQGAAEKTEFTLVWENGRREDIKSKVTVSGTFTSETTVRGSWEGTLPDKDSLVKIQGRVRWNNLTGSGMWSAAPGAMSPPSLVNSKNVDLIGKAFFGRHYARAPFVQSDYAYVCAAGGLMIFDVSEPANPSMVAFTRNPQSAAVDVYVSG